MSRDPPGPCGSEKQRRLATPLTRRYPRLSAAPAGDPDVGFDECACVSLELASADDDDIYYARRLHGLKGTCAKLHNPALRFSFFFLVSQSPYCVCSLPDVLLFLFVMVYSHHGFSHMHPPGGCPPGVWRPKSSGQSVFACVRCWEVVVGVLGGAGDEQRGEEGGGGSGRL